MKRLARTTSAAVLFFCGAALAQRPAPEAPSGWTPKTAVIAVEGMIEPRFEG